MSPWPEMVQFRLNTGDQVGAGKFPGPAGRPSQFDTQQVDMVHNFHVVQCTMCILSSTMALWSKAEIQKYTFWWEKNVFEAIFPMLF